ncbi:hypothetical protein BEWA_004160 [Theileria equi strain WA]|uniref:Uncharacterized protein n=1 Tax=Theileria equi strain WA TaxID=1537102 RepID=L0B0I9_THEEQ|nr:hypothetical protein BEWA_004160 [Theileria equi strain WA]AFZ81008.1 hypothetical protein BEWA_004160 [Theileria equi strain WA]|eukprot:XP_004830674.1 hypothetical protein BEWA_004160 [Theileria equi strain WA]
MTITLVIDIHNKCTRVKCKCKGGAGSKISVKAGTVSDTDFRYCKHHSRIFVIQNLNYDGKDLTTTDEGGPELTRQHTGIKDIHTYYSAKYDEGKDYIDKPLLLRIKDDKGEHWYYNSDADNKDEDDGERKGKPNTRWKKIDGGERDFYDKYDNPTPTFRERFNDLTCKLFNLHSVNIYEDRSYSCPCGSINVNVVENEGSGIPGHTKYKHEYGTGVNFARYKDTALKFKYEGNYGEFSLDKDTPHLTVYYSEEDKERERPLLMDVYAFGNTPISLFNIGKTDNSEWSVIFGEDSLPTLSGHELEKKLKELTCKFFKSADINDYCKKEWCRNDLGLQCRNGNEEEEPEQPERKEPLRSESPDVGLDQTGAGEKDESSDKEEDSLTQGAPGLPGGPSGSEGLFSKELWDTVGAAAGTVLTASGSVVGKSIVAGALGTVGLGAALELAKTVLNTSVNAAAPKAPQVDSTNSGTTNASDASQPQNQGTSSLSTIEGPTTGQQLHNVENPTEEHSEVKPEVVIVPKNKVENESEHATERENEGRSPQPKDDKNSENSVPGPKKPQEPETKDDGVEVAGETPGQDGSRPVSGKSGGPDKLSGLGEESLNNIYTGFPSSRSTTYGGYVVYENYDREKYGGISPVIVDIPITTTTPLIFTSQTQSLLTAEPTAFTPLTLYVNPPLHNSTAPKDSQQGGPQGTLPEDQNQDGPSKPEQAADNSQGVDTLPGGGQDIGGQVRIGNTNLQPSDKDVKIQNIYGENGLATFNDNGTIFAVLGAPAGYGDGDPNESGGTNSEGPVVPTPKAAEPSQPAGRTVGDPQPTTPTEGPTPQQPKEQYQALSTDSDPHGSGICGTPVTASQELQAPSSATGPTAGGELPPGSASTDGDSGSDQGTTQETPPPDSTSLTQQLGSSDLNHNTEAQAYHGASDSISGTSGPASSSVSSKNPTDIKTISIITSSVLAASGSLTGFGWWMFKRSKGDPWVRQI